MTRPNPVVETLSRHAHERIDIADNPIVRQWTHLETSAEARLESGLFVVEGLRAVEWLLLRSEFKLKRLVVVADEMGRREPETRGRVARVIESAASAGVGLTDVSREVYRKIANVKKIRGVLAVVHRPADTIADLADRLAATQGLGLAAVNLNDPGNLGSLMRSGVAFGATALFSLEGSADPFMPKTVRASAGHLLPAARGGWREFEEVCQRNGIFRIGLSADAKETLDPRMAGVMPWTNRPVVLCVGSEGDGFPKEISGFDLLLRIPMDGAAESLNAAVAGAIGLWGLRMTANKR